MTNISKPHDVTYKKAMSDPRIAQEFLSQHLPADLKKQMDFASLKRCPDSYVDEALKEKCTDMLYSVMIDGHIGYIYTLLEHQSKPDKFMTLRIAKYVLAIMENHASKNKPAPLVYPIVLYNGKQPYPFSSVLADSVEAPSALIKKYLLKGFQLVDLTQVPDNKLRTNTWAGLLQFFLKHARDRNFLSQLKRLMPNEIRAILDNDGEHFILVLLNYCIVVSNLREPEQLAQLATTYLSKEIGETVMSLGERLIEQGVQRGLEQGLERGLEQGLERGIEQGLEQGMEAAQIRIARNLLKEKADLKWIAKATQLPLAKVKQLQLQAKH